MDWERHEQNDTRGKRGVYKVLPDSAEHLLDDDDGDDAAERRDKQVDIDRQVQREQYARNDGAQIADGIVPLHYLSADILR